MPLRTANFPVLPQTSDSLSSAAKVPANVPGLLVMTGVYLMLCPTQHAKCANMSSCIILTFYELVPSSSIFCSEGQRD